MALIGSTLRARSVGSSVPASAMSSVRTIAATNVGTFGGRDADEEGLQRPARQVRQHQTGQQAGGDEQDAVPRHHREDVAALRRPISGVRCDTAKDKGRSASASLLTG
jgi:hypothetical protein